MHRPRVTIETSAKHLMLIDMAKRRAPTQSRLDMLMCFHQQLEVYGRMTPAQIGLCQTTIAGSS